MTGVEGTPHVTRCVEEVLSVVLGEGSGFGGPDVGDGDAERPRRPKPEAKGWRSGWAASNAAAARALGVTNEAVQSSGGKSFKVKQPARGGRWRWSVSLQAICCEVRLPENGQRGGAQVCGPAEWGATVRVRWRRFAWMLWKTIAHLAWVVRDRGEGDQRCSQGPPARYTSP